MFFFVFFFPVCSPQISLQNVRDPVSSFPSNIILVHDNEHDQDHPLAGHAKKDTMTATVVNADAVDRTADGSPTTVQQSSAAGNGRMAVCVKPIHYEYDQVSGVLSLSLSLMS